MGKTTKKKPFLLTINDRAYQLMWVVKRGKVPIDHETFVAQVKKNNAHLGKEDCDYIMKYADKIPVQMRGKVNILFTDYAHPEIPRLVACIYWGGDSWIQYWSQPSHNWFGPDCVLTRVK